MALTRILGTRTLLVSALTLSLAACMGGGTQQVAVPDCTFPDAPEKAAPGWVCDEPVPGLAVSSVGSADKSGAGLNFMKQQASTAARVQLAQMMKVQVQNMVKQFAETTGVGDSETVDMVNSSVTKQLTNETLVGTRMYKSKTSPNGTLYVLVGLDDKAASLIHETALKTSMNNEKALWQKFQSKKGHDELAKEISAMNAQ
ncbi:MAG: LPP20 family lipoprotein [Bermanella sp.]